MSESVDEQLARELGTYPKTDEERKSRLRATQRLKEIYSTNPFYTNTTDVGWKRILESRLNLEE